MRRPLAMLALVSCVALAACLPDITGPSDPATEHYADWLGIDLNTFQKTSDGVYYRDSVVGAGAAVDQYTFAAIYYVNGYLVNGAAFYQSGDVPDTVQLSSLAPGWREGMLGMHEGGLRRIIIPSELGFGNAIVSGVPRNSTLIVDVNLVKLP